MKRDIEKLASSTFDLVIIGGGITGACLAHDAALRGFSVALIEKNDFGMSTSSASSKLLHGGIRYLQKLQLGKVRESARERTYFQVIAPHSTTNIPFLIPTIKGSVMKGKAALLAGMTMYRLICSGLNGLISDPSKKVEFGRLFSKDAVLEMVPLLTSIDGLSGAHTLFETHMNNSERMTLAFVKSAVRNGAQAANYAAATTFMTEGDRIVGVNGIDRLNGRAFRVRAKLTINAAGPFLSAINSQLDSLRLFKQTTGFSKGVHIVVNQLEETYALALSSGKKTEGLVTRGGRHIFMIPWRGRTLIGTTNVPYDGDLEQVRVTRRDIDDFLQDINAIVPGISLGRDDVHYAFAGLYPLISDEIKADTYQGTGEYQVVDHRGQNGPEGIMSVLGAKYTTARAIAEKAIDTASAMLLTEKRDCKTATEPLFEGRIDALVPFITRKQTQYRDMVSAETVHHLVVAHGSEIDNVISYCQRRSGYLEKFTDQRETLVGEAAYAVEHEMACTLDDVVFARTGLGTIGHPGKEVLEHVCAVIGPMLGWDERQCAQEIESVERRYEWFD